MKSNGKKTDEKYKSRVECWHQDRCTYVGCKFDHPNKERQDGKVDNEGSSRTSKEEKEEQPKNMQRGMQKHSQVTKKHGETEMMQWLRKPKPEEGK